MHIKTQILLDQEANYLIYYEFSYIMKSETLMPKLVVDFADK